MAALRVFARFVTSATIHPRDNICNASKYVISLVNQQNKRWASFKTSSRYSEETKYTDFEVSKNPQEWEYVESLLKPKLIPSPPKILENSPSGWKPQTDESKVLPYFVDRSKNHMVPVYLHRRNRGIRRLTVIRHVQGDIYKMAEELKQHVETAVKKEIGIQVKEPSGLIKLRGDHVTLVKQWLENKGL